MTGFFGAGALTTGPALSADVIGFDTTFGFARGAEDLESSRLRALGRTTLGGGAGTLPFPTALRPRSALDVKAGGAATIRAATLVLEVAAATGGEVPYTTATMIETPRAALRARELAPLVDAFSFGTNDLTQLTFGFSRDDVSTTYVPTALAGGMISRDPFRSVDPHGVARLVGIAVAEGRAVKPGLVTGVCGEHGGDPASIAVFHRMGLDHVSCSASRVEVARLAAARAALGVGGPDASA